MKDSLQEIRYMHWSLIKFKKTVKSCADSAPFKFDVGLCLYPLNTNKIKLHIQTSSIN